MAEAVTHVVSECASDVCNMSTVCENTGTLNKPGHDQHSFALLNRHVPRDSWRTVLRKDLSALNVESKWYKLAQNRQTLRQLSATVRTYLGSDPD